MSEEAKARAEVQQDLIAEVRPEPRTLPTDEVGVSRDLLLAALGEIRTWSAHYGNALNTVIKPRHDTRLDGECVTCALIGLLQDAVRI